MIKVSVSGIDPKRWAANIKRQSDFAKVVAATRTAKIAQKMIVDEIKKFDRPTRYALGATFLRPATKADPTAYVWLKNRAGQAAKHEANYLYPQTFGGKRGRKAYETALLRAGILNPNEYTVPARGFPLDQYGNIGSGIIMRILSQLKASETTLGRMSNRTDSTRSKRAVARAGHYFVPKPGSSLPRGIYWRGGGVMYMALKFVRGAPKYKVRLPIFKIANEVKAKHFAREFDIAFSQAMNSSQSKWASR
jgi:hypothetical protein